MQRFEAWLIEAVGVLVIGKRRFLVVVGVCSITALVVGLYRSGIVGSRFDAARQAQAERAAGIESPRKSGERSYTRLAMKQVDEPVTAEAIAAIYVPLYIEAARDAGVALPERDVAEIAQLASAFLYYRSFRTSPNAYVEWMGRSGYPSQKVLISRAIDVTSTSMCQLYSEDRLNVNADREVVIVDGSSIGYGSNLFRDRLRRGASVGRGALPMPIDSTIDGVAGIDRKWPRWTARVATQ